MRQAYQNKRARGRSRKGPNPLTKTYESNGPDVKIRGTASHIAEKYISLSRDAQSSGDYIQAENYLQHAEHYLRIIAAAQPQQQPQQANFEQRSETDDDASEAEDSAAEATEGQERRRNGADGRNAGRQRRQQYRGVNGEASGEPIVTADTPQPFVESMLPKPANTALNGGAEEASESAVNGKDVSETPAVAAEANVDGAPAVAEDADGAEKPARRRGRPRKPRTAEAGEAAERPARRRGRPPKSKTSADSESAEV